MTDTLPAAHQQDLDFMRQVKEASLVELRTLLKWQCQEHWKRVAVLREIERKGRHVGAVERVD